jgi:hypothetical protein
MTPPTVPRRRRQRRPEPGVRGQRWVDPALPGVIWDRSTIERLWERLSLILAVRIRSRGLEEGRDPLQLFSANCFSTACEQRFRAPLPSSACGQLFPVTLPSGVDAFYVQFRWQAFCRL